MAGRSTTRRLLFGLGSVVLALGLVELTLDALRLLSPTVRSLLGPPGASVPQVIPDERLGHRPNPEVPGRDERGFRNPAVPRSAPIVALGDSQTWGMGVAADEAWPRLLEQLIGKLVYSMAFGGWGPVHSLELWAEAEALEPEVIIEAFYAGNDLYDAFRLVYLHGRHQELASRDEAIRAAVALAQSGETIEQRVAEMFEGRLPTPAGREREVVERQGEPPFWSRSALYGLLRRTVRELGTTRASGGDWIHPRSLDRAKEEARRSGRVAGRGGAGTILTPEYRLAALDLDDPRIREGLSISVRAIERMSRQAELAGTDFLVLLLPTKERVFESLVAEPSPALVRMLENEEALWGEMKSKLDNEGIAFLDLLPVLRAELDAGRAPYPATRDGHPNASGHHAIAASVAAVLERPTRRRAD